MTSLRNTRNGHLSTEDFGSAGGGSTWKTYNFEVAGHHTYVADDIRVHNDSAEYTEWLASAGEDADPFTQNSFYVAFTTGASYRRDGAVDFWKAGDGSVGQTLSNSRYSLSFLDHYGVVDAYGTAKVTFGGQLRALGDWLGFDREFGLQGNFARPEEGNRGQRGDGAQSQRNAREDNSNVGKWGGDRDGDGVPNWRDFEDGVGYADRQNRKQKDDDSDGGGSDGRSKPILLDLDGDGIDITSIDDSLVFMETSDDGLKSRTAWAGAGDGVLFYDADGDGAISEKREYVFTEWDPTASSDIEALANVFDSNGDGIFDAFDDAWADFRVMVTNADGSHTARSLADLGIISISLDPDATSIELPDGSMITGQTTFTWADGSTGLVGDVVLATEEQGYDVESVVTVDGSGNRTEVQTGYAGDGSIAFVVTSATSAEGSLIVNRYDDDGDGVVDRLQTIATTTDLDGSETRSVTNSLGNDQSTAVIQNAVSTTKSPDGANVLIERDTTGGGWFDQVESREEQPDGSWLNTMSYLAHDGSLQRKVTETVSADGLTRVEEIDEDGDGNLNFSVNHTIVVNGDGSRAETTTTTNNDGSLRSSMVETASADGRTKTVSYDRDGDGVFEEIVDTVIAVNSDGSTTSTRVVKNDDGSIRSSSTIGQSDDTLTKTTNADVDGDGDIDTSIVEQVTIASDGAREEQITVTNVDGSVREMTKVILDGDKIGGQTWVDLNRDGAFDPSELVRETVVHPVSGEVTTTVFDRADDGSVHGHTTTLTSTDGLVSVTTVDADGNGFSDTVISEAKVANGDGSSSTTTDVRNGDGSLRSTSVSTSSSDGLQTVVEADLDADGVVESRTEIQRQSNGDGSNGVTTHIHADDGTLLSSSHDLYSSDRLAHTRSSDTDGDGAVDWEVARVTSLDGETTVNDRRFHPDGSLASQTLTVTSSNGLLTTTSSDADGDGVYENTTYSVTVLNSDGSRTTSVTVQNADGTDRSQTRETVSDDALSIIQEVDQNADGVFDTTTQTSTNFAQNGSTITTAVVSAADGSVIRRSLEEVSDDGLRKVTGLDPDGDGSFDLITTVARTLLADGGFSELLEVRGSGGELRSAVTESLSGDGNNRTILRDVDGDGLIDARETQTEAPDGTTELITESLAPDGSVQSRTVSMISADGLTVTEERDIDGDGTADLISDNKTTLEADGSRKSVTQNLSSDGVVHSKEEASVSDDGQTTETRWDADNDGDFDLATITSWSIAADGSRTESFLSSAADGSSVEQRVFFVSGDGQTEITSTDYDGDGQFDSRMTQSQSGEGQKSLSLDYYTGAGIVMAAETITISADGLTVISRLDRNGNGTTDLHTRDVTDLAADGSTSRVVTYRDDHYVKVASEEHLVSDDGLLSIHAFDMDGDGQINVRTKDRTELRSDGSTVRTLTTRDTMGVLIALETLTFSANGLTETRQLEMSNAGVSWTNTKEFGSDGGYRETRTGQGQETETLLSADERTYERKTDTNSDGTYDRQYVREHTSDQSVLHTYRDLDEIGVTDAELSYRVSANGLNQTLLLDLNADGQTDISRIFVSGVDANGNSFLNVQESLESGNLTYSAQRSTSGDGLKTIIYIDGDGDGEIDATQTLDVILNDNGSKTTITETRYSDGELRALTSEYASANGRVATSHYDFDGNGIIDKKIDKRTNPDGSTRTVEETFEENGLTGNTFVTTTTADGLLQTILRDGNAQTIARSPLNNGSYVWNDGAGSIVTHEIDTAGNDHWRYQTSFGAIHSATLDPSTKDSVLAEAGRLYDTLLDRDLDFTEQERLVKYIHSGELNHQNLANDLKNGSEFATRYGTLDDLEFIHRIFLNTYGREPSLSELSEHAEFLGSGGTRSNLAVNLSESAEHIFLGNTYMPTNNYDVIMNPAQFERLLDRVEAEDTVKRLVEVVFDRVATAHEIDYFVDKLLDQDATPKTIATDLINLAVANPSSPFAMLSGGELVFHVFKNALGRHPTAEELTEWTHVFPSGSVTQAGFVSSVALSLDAQSKKGNYLGNGALDTVEVPYDASSGVMNGGSGPHEFIWSSGDKDVTIKDGGGSSIEADRLVLKAVDPSDVILERLPINDNLMVRVKGDGSYESSVGVLYFEHYFADGISTVDELDLFSVNAVGRMTKYFNPFHWEAGFDQYHGGDGDNFGIKIYGTISIQTAGAYTFKVLSDDGSRLWINDHLVVDNDGYHDDQERAGTLDLQTGQHTIEIAYFDRLYEDDLAVSVLGPGTNGQYLDLFESGMLSYAEDAAHLMNIDATSYQGDLAGYSTIIIEDQFYSASSGKGIEEIAFDDGTIWTQRHFLRQTELLGTFQNDTLSGTYSDEKISARSGNDTINSANGDDTLIGGLGNDTLNGGAGSDTYQWGKGDGDDLIGDYSASKSDIDTLQFLDVSSDEVELSVVDNDYLRVLISSTDEVLKVADQFEQDPVSGNSNLGHSVALGKGIERIVFADDVIWDLSAIYERTRISGDSNSNTVNGTDLHDNLFGLNGQDILNGKSGDDVLVGGLGTDTLKGGHGSDRYLWSKGDGSDLIDDDGTSRTELDRLVFSDVSAGDVYLSRPNHLKPLVIKIISTGEEITVDDHFDSPTTGLGIEEIEFSDGLIWNRATIHAITSVSGTSGNDTLHGGWAGEDTLLGKAGQDILYGYNGDDVLVGGEGNDTLRGDNGNDTYLWEIGDGNDFIDDEGQSLVETDTLVLQDVRQSEASLTRNGEDLNVTIIASSETITIDERFRSATAGEGIELIVYEDGIVTEILASSAAKSSHAGTIASDTIVGWGFTDIMEGFDGTDILDGQRGNDTLVGGKGNDKLYGDEGGDTYIWSLGDGNDLIEDQKQGEADSLDRLVLKDVDPNGILISRPDDAGASSDHIFITIIQSGEVIEIKNQVIYHGSLDHRVDYTGIEEIEFSNGVIWSREEITRNSQTWGTPGADDLDGLGQADDNLFGFEGNDTIDGNGGDDTFVGGAGNDKLYGDLGNDTYIWSVGDGDDVIDDDFLGGGNDTDRLILTDVAPADVSIHRPNNAGSSSDHIFVTIGQTGEVIELWNQLIDHDDKDHRVDLTGIEEIEFGDGTVWDRSKIDAETKTLGTAGNDNLDGLHQANDNLFGFDGNDTLDGNGGDDHLRGGTGDDVLYGNNGHDTYYWALGDGNDRIEEGENSERPDETDRLIFADVASHAVELSRPLSDPHNMEISILGGTETILVVSQFADTKVGRGLEYIEFSDGVYWELADIHARARLEGTSASENIKGKKEYDDNIFGYSGDDTLDGGEGNDLLNGGAGNDVLIGWKGNDTYIWSKGDGDDRIREHAEDRGNDIDGLKLLDVSSDDLALNRINTDPNSDLRWDLYLEVLSTNETIRIQEQFYWEAHDGKGLEYIEFADGVIWAREQIEENTKGVGTQGNDVMSGLNALNDHLLGLAGNDAINGFDGNDTLDGGAGNDTLTGSSGNDSFIGGTGDDVLYGNNGHDTYYWALGDGNDRIEEGENSERPDETDRLIFADVASHEVELSRPLSDPHNMEISILGGTETILIVSQFADTKVGRGLEYIEFSDGVYWELADIHARARLEGTSASESILGKENYGDHIFGHEGNDTLDGLAGDDHLHGGLGNDTLFGRDGSDTYYWTRGEGSDRIDGEWSRPEQTDLLVFADVSSADVTLTYFDDWNQDMMITISGTSETIRVDDQFSDTYFGRGLEAIWFSDDVTWALEDIHSNARLEGTSGSDNLVGKEKYGDHIYGLAGNDTLNGQAGDDHLYGGLGADHLDGGGGHDTASYKGAAAGLLASLEDASVNTGEAAGDTYVSIENLLGSDFDDNLSGDSDANLIVGHDGNDSLFGGGGADILYGGGNDDTLVGNSGPDTLMGGAGTDTVSYATSPEAVNVDLEIVASGDPGALSNQGGDASGDILIDVERVEGSSFNDVLSAAISGSTLYGGDGDDNISGRSGHDILRGDNGLDTIYGGDGDDEIDGGDGRDTLFGGSGSDLISGGSGYDLIDAGAGNDLVYGGQGRDVVDLGAGDDTFIDTAQNDSNGHDTVDGGSGNDKLRIGGGDNVFTGGAGSDTFIFNEINTIGASEITDFEVGLDKLEFTWLEYGDLTFSNNVAALNITWQTGQVHLLGLTAADISESDFVFV